MSRGLAAHRPAGFGVEVLLGGLTVYNSSRDKTSLWTVEAQNLSGGSKDRPLRGSGVFVFGGWFIPVDADMSQAPAPTPEDGSIELTLPTTGEVHPDGGIPKGIGNLIAGGVFFGSGVHARNVVNEGPTTTFEPNDMVLDNWGKVDSWITTPRSRPMEAAASVSSIFLAASTLWPSMRRLKPMVSVHAALIFMMAR